MSLNKPMMDDGDAQGVSFLDQLPDATSSDGAGQTLRAEFRTRLQAALDELPQEQREVFVMREFGGLKFREIAVAMSVSENTVKSRMRYALEALRGHLADYREHSFDRDEEVGKPSAKSGII
jgi:RNA polymerase sigma-70 factor (ECF subfamily)